MIQQNYKSCYKFSTLNVRYNVKYTKYSSYKKYQHIVLFTLMFTY